VAKNFKKMKDFRDEEYNDPKSARQVRTNQLIAEQNKLLKEGASLAEKVTEAFKDNNEALQKGNSFTNNLLSGKEKEALLSKVVTKEGIVKAGVSKKQLKFAMDGVKALDKQDEAIRGMMPGVLDFADNIAGTFQTMKLMSGTFLGWIGIIVAIAGAFLKLAKEVADTRKELGVSAATAGKIAIQTKLIGIQAKAWGLDVEDIKEAQAAIRNDLGASVHEAADLSLLFARTSAATGQTASQLTKTLSIMEAVSGASREALLNQIRSNAAMIEAQGVTPALVMQDIAENSEFFATYAKQGGQNLIQAGTAARKLGLNMSTVASITEGLMDFESSIEASMHASQLLGREINTDRARMLAMTGDQAGLMEEVQRLVGSEAEFTKMLAPQRMALAKAFNTDVESLARMVRNQGPAATGAAAGGAMSNVQITPSSDVEAHRLLGKIARNTE